MSPPAPVQAPPAMRSYPPQQQPQQYAPQAYPQQAPASPIPQGYAPQQPYSPQSGMPHYSQGYAPQHAPGMVPHQMAATTPNFNLAEVVRAAQIKKEYRAITARLLLTVLVTIVAGARLHMA